MEGVFDIKEKDLTVLVFEQWNKKTAISSFIVCFQVDRSFDPRSPSVTDLPSLKVSLKSGKIDPIQDPDDADTQSTDSRHSF